METLARFFVTLTELFEAEGRVLKRQLVYLIVAAGFGLIILGLVITGLGFLLLWENMWLPGRAMPQPQYVMIRRERLLRFRNSYQEEL